MRRGLDSAGCSADAQAIGDFTPITRKDAARCGPFVIARSIRPRRQGAGEANGIATTLHGASLDLKIKARTARVHHA